MRYCLSFQAIVALLCVVAPAAADDWPQFRGPGGASVADAVSLPVEWSVETGQNIAWSADLPGDGVSSPIVVDGRVIVTAASGADRDQLHVLAFDSMTGKALWSRQFWATGRTLCYRTSSVAAPTPVSDGEHVLALYSSNDLVCLDLEGNLKWIRGLAVDHPGLGNDIGMASSPVVVDGAVVVQCESKTASFAAAYEIETGATRWEVPRPRDSNWTSPTVVAYSGAAQTEPGVLVQGEGGLQLLAARSGDVLWDAEVEGASIASPSSSGELVLSAASGVTALRRTTDGMEVVWRQTGVNPGSPSPVAYGDQVFVIGRGGILSAVNANTGEKSALKKRLGGTFWATPLAAAGRLYCINQDGKAFVVDPAGKGEILAEVSFGEEIYGSPAAADGGMFVRSNGKLWKIAIAQQAGRSPAPQPQ